jgi:hypothetical protein
MRRLLLLLVMFSGTFMVGCSPGQGRDGHAADATVELTGAPETAASFPSPAMTDKPDSSPLPDPTKPGPTATAIERSTDTPPPDRPTIEPSATALPQLTFHDLSLSANDIFIFPVPVLIAGDPVSIQVMPTIPHGLAPNDVDVRIMVDGQELVIGNLNWRKLSGDTVGLYQWVWDTTGQAGEHTVTAVLDPLDLIQIGDEDPDNNQATKTVNVQPAAAFPDVEVNAQWRTTTISCCVIHTVTGTAANRDLQKLLPQIEAAFSQASLRLDEPLAAPYHVYLVDRVFGQGGYANDRMVVSYLDRNYAGGGLNELLVHEATHLIDDAFATDQITFLSEGLAVWASGGHYQQQDLGQWMAALIELGQYAPISDVTNNFFSTQHEISYLEGGSLIDYLVNTYRWPTVRGFFTEVTADDGATLADAVDLNMRASFGRTLKQVESDWLTYLSRLPRDREARENLSTTIRYYDVMRRYQIAYDPTAYYLYAWLPSPELAEQMEATADFTRHPKSDINISLEAMLLSANQSLLLGDLSRSNALLDSVDRVINNEGRFLDPLARAYWNIVTTVSEMGFEIQQLTVSGNEATGLVKRPDESAMTKLQLVLRDDLTWRPLR